MPLDERKGGSRTERSKKNKELSRFSYSTCGCSVALTCDRRGGTGRPSSTATHVLSPTPIDMIKSQEKTGFFKRCIDSLTPSSSKPPSQPGSSHPDRPAKNRTKPRNWFNKSSTTLPSRPTSPPYPTSLTENPSAETTLGEHSLISSVRTQWLTQS